MRSPDVDAIKGLLQALESTLDALDGASAAATQLTTAQRAGKPLAPSVLERYERQFATLTKTAGADARNDRSLVDLDGGAALVITQRTVFVLGAGASVPYGFQSGAQLSRSVADDLRGPGSALWTRLESNGVDARLLREFSRVFRETGRNSLDVFLQSRKEFSDLGRMAIAFLISSRESEETLYPADEQQDWIKYLLNQMLGTAVEDFQSNKLKVITFNFDRSFERRVFLAVRASYGLGEGEAFALCQQTIPILHLHGDLGEPGWGNPVSEWARPYGPIPDDQSRTDLKRWAGRIRIVHDDIEHATINQAHDWLREAQQACFIGLSYNDLILKRLRVSALAGAEPRPSFHGTFHGMERAEIDAVKREFKGHISEYITEAYWFLRKCDLYQA